MKKFSMSKKQLFNTYGSNYTKTDLIITLVMFVVAVGLMCYLHHLNVYYSLMVVLVGICCLPIVVSSYFKYKYERSKFEDFCIYFESMKTNFKLYRKINTSLEMTQKLLKPKSEMYKMISKALIEIGESGDYEKALNYIDAKFHNTYLGRLHNLMIVGEKQGGDSVYYNLDKINYNYWKRDLKTYQNKKKTYRYIFYGIVFFCLVVSLYGIYIYKGDVIYTTLINNPTYQLYTMIELVLMLLSFIYIYCKFVNEKWIRSDD